MNSNIFFGIIGFVIVISLAVVGFLAMRYANSVMLQTKIITPKEGIECVVVSATDSTSVDCWVVNEIHSK